MTEIKEHLIKVFSAFISFCEEHNLTYYAACGTVLGAVRHHGFIPWDDDLDVYMPRKDYERLKLLQEKIPTPYKLADITELGYTAPFMKFMDVTTSIWEFANIPYMLGVYVDIFPLDNCPSDPSKMLRIKEKLNSVFFKYFRSIEVWNYQILFKLLIARDWDSFCRIFKTKFCYATRKRLFHNQILNFLKELSSTKDGPFLFNSTDVYAECLVFKKEWFEHPIDMPFENLTIKIPNAYDEYLHYLYDDYMKLPPLEERQSHHSRHYVCLDKWVSIQEAKRALKRNKN